MKRTIAIGILMLVLIGLGLALLVPAYQSVPNEKKVAAYTYFTAIKHRKTVEAVVKERGTLAGIVPTMKRYDEKQDKFGVVVVMVHNNGMISAVNSKFKMNLTLVPTLVDGAVRWDCSFQPREYGPPSCKAIAVRSTTQDLPL